MKWWRLRTVDARVVEKEMSNVIKVLGLDDPDIIDESESQVRYMTGTGQLRKSLSVFKPANIWNSQVKGLMILKAIMSKPNGNIANGT